MGAAVIMLVVVLVYQQLENNILTPKIQGKAVNLSAFFIIIAVTLFGALLGVLGALTAVPLAAMIQIVVQEVTTARREQVAEARAASCSRRPSPRSLVATGGEHVGVRETLSSWIGRRALGRAALGAMDGYGRHATSQFAAAISYRVLFSLVPLVSFLVAVADAVLPDKQRDAVARWLASVVPGQALDPTVEQALTGSRVAPTVAGLVVARRPALGGERDDGSDQGRVPRHLGERPAANLRPEQAARLPARSRCRARRRRGARSDADRAGARRGRTRPERRARCRRGGPGRCGRHRDPHVRSRDLRDPRRALPLRPADPARVRAIWLPALLATIGFQLATAIYALYLARFGDVSAVYGPLGAVLGFLLVVYVGIIVILLGAELVAAWPPPTPEPGPAPPRS